METAHYMLAIGKRQSLLVGHLIVKHRVGQIEKGNADAASAWFASCTEKTLLHALQLKCRGVLVVGLDMTNARTPWRIVHSIHVARRHNAWQMAG